MFFCFAPLLFRKKRIFANIFLYPLVFLNIRKNIFKIRLYRDFFMFLDVLGCFKMGYNGARGRTRTDTRLPLPDFESGASTGFTTRAKKNCDSIYKDIKKRLKKHESSNSSFHERRLFLFTFFACTGYYGFF